MCEHCHEHEEHEEHSRFHTVLLIVRIIVSLTLALLGRFLFTEESYSFALHFILMLGAYLIIAYDVILEAFEDLFKEKKFFTEEMLMVLASIGAFCLRFYGPDHDEFLEATLVILFFQIGEMLEDFAEERSKGAILGALDLRKEEAMVEQDGTLVPRRAEDLALGDIVVLSVGRKVLCDGIVLSGEGAIDESSLTGESLPKEKHPGERVYSGTILQSGSLRVQVDVPYEESTSARLSKLIEEAAEHQTPTERFIDKFAKVYTPIVFLLALLIAVIPPLFLGIGNGQTWSSWIYASLSFLVISCPCAIVISVPLAFFSGLGLASKNGILVKGGNHLEALCHVSLAAFDKTGTLTQGSLSPKEIVPIGMKKDEFLGYLIAAEQASTHPIAKAIASLGISPYAAEEISVSDVPGKGIKGAISGHEVLVGNASLFLEQGIAISETGSQATTVHLAVDHVYAGYVSFTDQVKKNAKETIAFLRENRIKTAMISGDSRAVAEEIGTSLGLDEIHAELLPEDKQNYLQKEKANHVILYCGDGINDAPSLATADVGVAMGALGSDLTYSSADCVILDDDIGKAVTLIDIAKKTRRRAIFNIAFSLTIKASVLALSAIAALTHAFSLPLYVAVLADTGLSMAMIASSLLLFFAKVKRTKTR